MSSRRIEDEVLPVYVPGFREAQASGAIHPVPLQPPQLIKGMSAVSSFWLYISLVVVSAVALIMLVNLLSGLVVLSSPFRLLIAAPGILWFFAILWGLRRVGDRLYAELARGYATFRPLNGGFHIGDGRAFGFANVRAPWNFAGVWALNRHGQVIAAPDRSVMAPGFYPSPHRSNQFELWTGRVWMGEYRK